MALDSIRQLLLVTARQAFTRADEADIHSEQVRSEYQIAVSGNRSRKQRDRLKAAVTEADAESIDAELDAGRAVADLRQFEEDHGMLPADVGSVEADEKESSNENSRPMKKRRA